MLKFCLMVLLLVPQSHDQSEDASSIEKLLDSRVTAWNRKDINALVASFDADVDYGLSDGESVSGKEEMRMRYQAIFNSIELGSSKTNNLAIRVNVVADDLAIADIDWHLLGIKTDNGKRAQDRFGNSVVVLRKKAGKWLIVSYRTSRCVTDDKAAVQKIITSRDKAWEAKDSAALTNCFADDCVYVSSRGEVIEGKAALRAKYDTLFLAAEFKTSEPKCVVEDVRFLDNGTAVVISNWTNCGIKTKSGAEDRQGSSIAVMVKNDLGVWEIKTLHVARH